MGDGHFVFGEACGYADCVINWIKVIWVWLVDLAGSMKIIGRSQMTVCENFRPIQKDKANIFLAN